jgi:hypothetical protein
MRHICAWCKKETAPPDGNDDGLESHGICETCRLTVMAELKARFLEAEAVVNWETKEMEG